MPDFSFTGTVSGLNHAGICTRLRRRHQPWLMRWGFLVAVFAYFVVLIVLMFAAALMGLRAQEWVTYVPFGLFVFAILALLRWRRSHVWDSVRNAPVRQAPQRFDLTPEGLRIQAQFLDSLLKWPAILDVIDDPEGLLLLTGQMEYIAIPAQAFDSPETLQEAKAACKDWIAAARRTDTQS